MDFQQSRTFINLQYLYENNLKASTEYEIFETIARKEILIEIANIYNTTSRNDRVMAEHIRRVILGGETNTQQNLIESIGDQQVLINLYREFSEIAREEGFNNIASMLNGMANIQMNHYNTFLVTSDKMANNKLFCSDNETLWICLACGNIMSRVCAPEVCPVCGYPQGYYQLLRE